MYPSSQLIKASTKGLPAGIIQRRQRFPEALRQQVEYTSGALRFYTVLVFSGEHSGSSGVSKEQIRHTLLPVPVVDHTVTPRAQSMLTSNAKGAGPCLGRAD